MQPVHVGVGGEDDLVVAQALDVVLDVQALHEVVHLVVLVNHVALEIPDVERPALAREDRSRTLNPLLANILQHNVQIWRSETDARCGNSIVAEIRRHVLVVRKRGCQRRNFWVLPRVIPANLLLPRYTS